MTVAVRAVVPGANVSARATETGQTRGVVSGADGAFRLSALPDDFATDPRLDASEISFSRYTSGRARGDTRIVGVKAVANNEPYLSRPVHGRPSLPPIILTEAVAQVGAILILAKPENKDQLTQVLTYHVVPGKVLAKDVKAGMVKTVQGSSLSVTTMGGVKVDSANVTSVDIAAANSTIRMPYDHSAMPGAIRAR